MSTKHEMIEFLVNERGLDGAQISGLDDDALENLYDIEKEEDEQGEFEDLEFTEIDENSPQLLASAVVPTYTDPDWNEYVLSQFAPAELYDGNPTVDGLRRVVELLIGEVVLQETTVVQTPTPENGGRATATVNVHIRAHDNGPTKGYSGSADACYENLQDAVKLYPVAMAETRAEGRALRRALRLRTVAAEELNGASAVPVAVTAPGDNEPPTKNQINMINMLAGNNERGLNINVEKLYGQSGKLTSDTAKDLIQKLSAFQSDKAAIPAEIVGYDSNWSTKI